MLLVPLASVPAVEILLGDVRRWDELLRIGDIVVRHKEHLHFLVDLRVGVHQIGHLVDILDNALGTPVARRSLGPKEEHGGMKVREGASFRAK